LQRLKCLHEVDSAAAPPGQLSDEYCVNLTSLSERHDFPAFDAVDLGAGRVLFVDSDDLEAAALGECAEIALLTLA
jgi:hypothetical protein